MSVSDEQCSVAFCQSAELPHIFTWTFSNTGMQCMGLTDLHHFEGFFLIWIFSTNAIQCMDMDNMETAL